MNEHLRLETATVHLHCEVVMDGVHGVITTLDNLMLESILSIAFSHTYINNVIKHTLNNPKYFVGLSND